MFHKKKHFGKRFSWMAAENAGLSNIFIDIFLSVKGLPWTKKSYSLPIYIVFVKVDKAHYGLLKGDQSSEIKLKSHQQCKTDFAFCLFWSEIFSGKFSIYIYCPDTYSTLIYFLPFVYSICLYYKLYELILIFYIRTIVKTNLMIGQQINIF